MVEGGRQLQVVRVGISRTRINGGAGGGGGGVGCLPMANAFLRFRHRRTRSLCIGTEKGNKSHSSQGVPPNRPGRHGTTHIGRKPPS